MMRKVSLLVAAGAGYVLGARAGRERYEQIKGQAQKFAGNPSVQDAAQKAQTTVTSQAGSLAGAAKEKATDVASAASEKVRGSSSSESVSPSGTATPGPTPGSSYPSTP